jgi:hypothetical protein
VAALVLAGEFHPKRRLASTYGWSNDAADAPPVRRVPGSYPRRKEVHMPGAIAALAIALLISMLVIDRLTR